jgi:Ni2+-binding GTPase involved in maturation of urease and hydrogenase
MSQILLVGGFLGAGKTTALERLASVFISRGRSVGLITNDQAEGLVDSHQLRSRGLRVEEIPGGCFCCRYDALVAATERLREGGPAGSLPEVILAEPVGSCTDLLATVVEPLLRQTEGRHRVAPFSVLVDPARARAILTGKRFGGFSARVAYIFEKQIEEAEILALNKIDSLPEGAAAEIIELLRAKRGTAEVIPISARTGAGFFRWLDLLDGPGRRAPIPDVDYDIYAEGEAELGWFNGEARLEAAQPVDVDPFLLDVAGRIGRRLLALDAEVAHVKIAFLDSGRAAVVNLARGGALPELGRPGAPHAREGRLIVNARVHLDPTRLRTVVEEEATAASLSRGARLEFGEVHSLRPGRPVPTHRFNERA